jgi:hypothetical protein
MNRNQIIKAIQDAARFLGVEHLTIPTFRRQTGIGQAAVLKHFDNWSEACAAADIKCGEPNRIHPVRISEEECISELQRVSKILGRSALSSKEFSQHARFTHHPVIERFGSWQNALAQAGLELCEQSKREILLSPKECIQEMQRVAHLLQQSYLTTDQFDANAQFSSYRVVRVFGRWHKALAAAGLQPSPNFKKDIPLSALAKDFLRVCGELVKIPTLIQLTRRSNPVSHTFAGKHGGYDIFKKKAIEYLFSENVKIQSKVRSILTEELMRLQTDVSNICDLATMTRPHYQGRTLNFRAFKYAPTCESDVVQMFGAIADELGFEIIGNRSEFPDCEARRKENADRERYKKCLIEYEFSSSDYRKHKHPIIGCDLIVCWMHNWKECPIEVLALQEAIKNLDGWK